MLLILVQNSKIKTDADREYPQKLTTGLSILAVIKIVINIIVSAVGSGGPATNTINTG